MKILANASLAIGFMAMFASPASAAKDEDAWASCIWEQVPTSAANWLATEQQKDRSLEPDNLYANLELRLRAACNAQLTPPKKDDPLRFNSKNVRAALNRSKPELIGPDLVEPETFHCIAREGDVIVGMSAGFGNAAEIRSSDPRVTLECKTVAADGTLIATSSTEDDPDA